MANRILLTSFRTWHPAQPSNSSDDLLLKVLQLNPMPLTLHGLRRVNVDFTLAPQQIVAQMHQLQPEGVVCCGMAESRPILTVESQARRGDRTLHTSIDLPHLVQGLNATHISHDAGRFVCNHVYYSVLQAVEQSPTCRHGLFVHVPILTTKNCPLVITDLLQILNRLQRL